MTNVRVQQRGDVTTDLTLSVGVIEETVTVEPTAASGVRFNSSSAELTVDRQLIDQAPIGGRNPYNLAALDPTVLVSPATNENRPYHHAYANDYDAGGGTRRANDVLLDGVPLGASYKTAYTPAVDAVEEITVSKNSVDAENGNSLGGIISLNMKSGTNSYPRLGLRLLPRSQPQRPHRSDAPRRRPARTPLRGQRAPDDRRRRSAGRSNATASSPSRRSSSGTTTVRCRSSAPCRPSSSAAAISASRS